MHSGFVSLVGRPNVGKSSIINAACGRKVSIVSDKPQTTRTRVRAIVHRTDANLTFLDAPMDTVTKKESTRWGLDARTANYTPGPLRGNATRLMVVTHASWLSQRSLATSQFDVLRFMPQCHLPTLVVWGTADAAGSAQSKKIFDASPDLGKKFVAVDGATHFMRGQAELQAQVADHISAWIQERGLD